jgi:hypothetical protein
MRRNCITCGAPTILAREIDNNLRVIDEEPVEGGPLVAFGDMLDQPTIITDSSPASKNCQTRSLASSRSVMFASSMTLRPSDQMPQMGGR